MLKLMRRRLSKVGHPPGTLIHVGEQKVAEVKITRVTYDEAHFEEEECTPIEDCFESIAAPAVAWINVDGLHQVEILEQIGKHFGLHPLVLEDILNTDQRPKAEDLGDYVFVVLKVLHYDEELGDLQMEQISLVLGPGYLLSFQERPEDLFQPIRERLRSGRGRIRKLGADYLAYALLDIVVDNYFVILERLGERIDFLEEALVSNPTPGTLQQIHDLKMAMIFLRNSVWPVREIVSSLERGESPLIQESTNIYLRDVYDHTIQVIDVVETFRDMLSGMLDTYLSSISNRMNEVMKVLTIFASIFIPLTFIAGVYGMNFQYMPELGWPWAYPILWVVLIGLSVVMLVYFRRKKWL